jgi:hypothetical protein
MKTIRNLSLPLLLLALAACGSHEQGVARISFSFDPRAPKLNHPAFLFVRVVENMTVTLGGKDAVPFDPTTGATLDPITIPNGNNRVVIAEIHDGSAQDSRVLYYGLSAPFSISPGKTTDVTVVLELTAPPGGASVTIVTPTPRYVRDPMVPLLLVSDTAVKARISNYVSFPPSVPGISDVPTQTVALDAATAVPMAGGLVGHMVTWNLNAGLGDPCTLRDYCPRQVFVRFIDAKAYESETKTSSIVLDTKPPSVIAGSVFVGISPPPNNPLHAVGKATYGSTASVSFTLSELVQGGPIVSSASAMHWGCMGSALSYQCATQIPMSAAEGMESVQITATDLAGNMGQFVVGSFGVDTTPPAIPDTSPGKIVYTRIPWGRGSSVAVSRYTLRGAMGAVEPSATLVAYNGPDTATGEEIGRTTAQPDGSFNAFDLVRADRDQVFVVAIDSAGNQSGASPGSPGVQATPVRDTEWIATLSKSAMFNPHRAASVPALRPSLAQDRDSEHDFTADDAARVSGRGGGSVEVSYGAPWLPIGLSAVNPRVQTEHAMAFDRARGVLVLFGGEFTDVTNVGSPAAPTNDTWEWDGHSWIKATPLGESPSPRFSHQLVYDAARGETILFGGTDGQNDLSDTWAWDGSRWAQLATTTATVPPPRHAHQMTYDSARGRVVLFGGIQFNGLALLADTWEWDGDRWIRKTTPGPIARASAALAYDRSRQRTVLFGGSVVTAYLNDAWEWDGAAWSHAQTSSIAPLSRNNMAMAYDEGTSRIVLFGGDALGQNLNGPVFGDAYAYNGVRWSKLSANFAPGITQHAMAYDSVRNELVVFGGIGSAANAIFSDTLISSAQGWKKVTPTGVAPPARERGAVAFDAPRGDLLLYGGLAVDFSPLFDTWTFDGYNWTPAACLDAMGVQCDAMCNDHLGNPCYPLAGGAVMAPDLARNTIVLAGLTDPTNPAAPESLYAWNGTRWLTPTTTTAVPVERDVTAMAYDSARRRTFLFGGLGTDMLGLPLPLADGWASNGRSWTHSGPIPVTGATPSARYGHAMASDGARGLVVLFGGAVNDPTGALVENADTWEWNGARAHWTKASTASMTPPPPRLSHRLVFDSARNRTLMFGGENFAGAVFGDLWQWDGTSWIQVPLAGARPAARARPSFAYDPQRHAIVLFGGFTTAAVSDTWELKVRGDDRPGAVFDIDWTKANQANGAITAIEVDAFAGGTGYADMAGGASQPGAAAEAWDAYAGSWIGWGANTASSTAIDALTAATSTSTPASHFVDGQGQIHVRIAPKTGVGQGGAFPDLMIDDFALIVRYRR